MTYLKQSATLGLCLGLSLGLGAVAGSQQAEAAWEPQKPVEFVIMAGAGGGADQLARLIQSIIQKNNWSSQPLIPINKGGGSGAEALRYLKDNSGNSHIVMATLNSYFTTPLRQPELGVDIAEFTPVARLAEDPFALWVHIESPIKSVDEWVADVKSKGTNYIVGGTGTAQEDSLVFAMLKDSYGLPPITYVPFEGGGDVAKNLIGKQIMATVNNPAEQMGFWQAGMSRPLAVVSPGRLAAMPDTPTFGELGHAELVYGNQRMIIAPGGIPAEAQQFYIDLFKKVDASPEWIKYTDEQALARAWLAGGDFGKFLVAERDKHRKLLKDLGEIQ